MFHVLTQTINEETMTYPGVVPLFEVWDFDSNFISS